MTIDLIHNIGLIIIGDAILWMGKNLPECPEWLHVDLNIDVGQDPSHCFRNTLNVRDSDMGSRAILVLCVLPRLVAFKRKEEVTITAEGLLHICLLFSNKTVQRAMESSSLKQGGNN